jgi:hypothetical protein
MVPVSSGFRHSRAGGNLAIRSGKKSTTIRDMGNSGSLDFNLLAMTVSIFKDIVDYLGKALVKYDCRQ